MAEGHWRKASRPARQLEILRGSFFFEFEFFEVTAAGVNTGSQLTAYGTHNFTVIRRGRCKQAATACEFQVA